MQATSARHAMEILGELVAGSGAGEGYGVLAADAQEAWCAQCTLLLLLRLCMLVSMHVC